MNENARDSENSNFSSGFQESVYNADGYHPGAELKEVRIREIIQGIVQSKRSRILDVGCGEGITLQSFCSAHDCYGIDVSEVQLAKARDKGIKTWRLDMERERFPFEDGSFDVVICSETIEHLLDIDNLFGEINRVLRRGGFFVLTFPNINQPVSWVMQVVFDLPPLYSARYKSPHVRDFTLRLVRHILTGFGFGILRAEGTYVYPNRGAFSQWLARHFPRLGEKVVVVSVKRFDAPKSLSKKVVWDVLELVGKSKRDVRRVSE